MRLEGKVAIITGGARGQGAAEAELFVQEGAKVVVTDIAPDGGKIAKALGESALFVHHNVSKQEDWQKVVETALDRFGRIDILINNAGIYRPERLQETGAELFDLHYRVNQLGVFLGMRAVLDTMLAAQSGAIVNISSIAGLKGNPGVFAYSATKWALRGMTRCAAADLARYGIRVNSVHPGIIDTPMLEANRPEVLKAFNSMIPLGRFGTVSDVANLVAFLASDEARYITGAEITVDGGVAA